MSGCRRSRILWAPAPLLIDEEEWSAAWVADIDTRVVGMVLTRDEWISDLGVLREIRGQRPRGHFSPATGLESGAGISKRGAWGVRMLETTRSAPR